MTSPSEEFVIRKRKIPLDVADTLNAEGISFTYLRVSDSSDANANVQLIFANLDNPGITLKRGIRLENFAIRSAKVWFTNTAQPGKFVEIEYWGGPPVGPPRIVNEGLIIDVVASKAATFDSFADVAIAAAATTQVLGVDTARRETIITNLAGNTVSFRIGDAGANATNGIELPPGSTIILATSAAVFAHNPGGVTQSLARAEVKD